MAGGEWRPDQRAQLSHDETKDFAELLGWKCPSLCCLNHYHWYAIFLYSVIQTISVFLAVLTCFFFFFFSGLNQVGFGIKATGFSG